MSERQFRSPNDVVRDALRAELTSLLGECSAAQQAFFLRVFPGGIDAQPEDKLRGAIDLCQRTIRKNEEDPSRLATKEARP